MARDFIINGETLVRVRGRRGTSIELTSELGLAEKEVRITPRLVHHDMKVDDFGPQIPPDVMWLLADCTINMTLVHYDKDILNTCLAESMAGALPDNPFGTLTGAGKPLGGGKPLYGPRCHFMTVSLTSPVLNLPWRFLACYLPDRAVEIPLGTNRTAALLQWRAIPYVAPVETTTTLTPGGTPSTTTNYAMVIPPRVTEAISFSLLKPPTIIYLGDGQFAQIGEDSQRFTFDQAIREGFLFPFDEEFIPGQPIDAPAGGTGSQLGELKSQGAVLFDNLAI